MESDRHLAAGPRERIQVFISAKSGDYEYADAVYRRLRDAGVAVFFSRESLPDLGVADYRREIDRALDEAEHLVVVTSSVDHVMAPWVEAEWGFFINEQRSGRKAGNLITVIVGGLTPASLPPSLRHNEVIPFEHGIDKLLRYVGSRPPDRARAAPVSQSPLRLSFQETGTFGGPPAVGLVAAAPVESVIATGGVDGAVRIYDAHTRTRRVVLGSARYWTARQQARVTALAFSPDGRRLGSGHLDGTLHLWDLESQQEIGPGLRHDLAIAGLVFSSDGRTLTTASKDGVVKRWDLSAPGPEPIVDRKPLPVVTLAAARGHGWLLTGLINTATRRYAIEIQSGDAALANVATLSIADSFTHLTLSTGDRLLAAGGRDGVTRIYDFEAVAQAIHRQQQRPTALSAALQLVAHTTPVTPVAFFADGRRAATCATDDQVIVWDLQIGQPCANLRGSAAERFVGVAVLPGGAVVGALADGRLRMWEEA